MHQGVGGNGKHVNLHPLILYIRLIRMSERTGGAFEFEGRW